MTNFDTVREALLDARSLLHDGRRQDKALTALAQIEADHFTSADMASAAASGFRDGVASVQQAQEQVGTFWQHPKTKEWYQQNDGEPLYRAAPVVQQPQAEAVLVVQDGEICYKSKSDDQSYGMWCPVTPDADHGLGNGTKLYAAPQQAEAYNKTELNAFVQDLYDRKMREGKHGHYETLFHCVHQAIKRVGTQSSPAWEHHAQKLTKWLHCMSYNDSYFGEPAGLVKQVTGELNRLIGTAPQQAEAVPPKRATGWAAPKDRYTTPVLFNPYTGEPRNVLDVQSDPQGILIVPPGALISAAQGDKT